MTRHDFHDFHQAWNHAHALSSSNQPPRDAVVMTVFDTLIEFPLAEVLSALQAHAQQSRFAPTPADMIEIIRNKTFGYPIGPDEAWAMVPADESETVVWTGEMAEAYRIAWEVIVRGDEIAARLAFRGAYERLCADASVRRTPVVWTISIGYDRAKIEPALLRAHQAGRITREQVNAHLPAPMDGGPIGGLLTGKVTDLPDNARHLANRWSELKRALQEGEQKLEEKKQQAIEETAQRRLIWEEKKQQAASIALAETKQAGAGRGRRKTT